MLTGSAVTALYVVARLAGLVSLVTMAFVPVFAALTLPIVSQPAEGAGAGAGAPCMHSRHHHKSLWLPPTITPSITPPSPPQVYEKKKDEIDAALDKARAQVTQVNDKYLSKVGATCGAGGRWGVHE